MIRSELVQKIADENPHLYQRDVERIVGTIFDEIIQAMADGNRVELRGFGAFSVKKRDARVGRNPRTGESVEVEQKHVPFFKTGKDVIDSKSFGLLENIATVLNAHPEIKQVRVEGHTDDVGDDAKNKDLSDRRAKAVVKYLVGKGVTEARLVGIGFGEEKPIADNATDDGKAQNRRVEFAIVQE